MIMTVFTELYRIPGPALFVEPPQTGITPFYLWKRVGRGPVTCQGFPASGGAWTRVAAWPDPPPLCGGKRGGDLGRCAGLT